MRIYSPHGVGCSPDGLISHVIFWSHAFVLSLSKHLGEPLQVSSRPSRGSVRRPTVENPPPPIPACTTTPRRTGSRFGSRKPASNAASLSAVGNCGAYGPRVRTGYRVLQRPLQAQLQLALRSRQLECQCPLPATHLALSLPPSIPRTKRFTSDGRTTKGAQTVGGRVTLNEYRTHNATVAVQRGSK
ncbi:hypothetical protein ZHAS_00018612 [Anopheles sinensis]|uniref:Uncharacterized protein n=1 Tax=Anopheles sinensis TaxID=74873 RepID=A0A084WJE8_ANOSI|nr:hypothetical protein ZHAS_00018612 [Anopheles sinensis]